MLMYQVYNTTVETNAKDYIRNYRDVDKFMTYCKQCDRYDACWSCPPFDFDIEEYLSKFDKAILFGTKIVLDETLRETCRGAQQCKDTTYRIIADVRRDLDIRLLRMEQEYIGSRAFSAGTCFRCPLGQCTRMAGKPCLFPGEIRYPLESFGFDIGKTASELLHIELQWSKNGVLPEYFTLVSCLFTPIERLTE
jgi:predicted metal-binding protein